MELRLALARDGTPTCLADGAFLHSPYSPGREADRLVAERLGQGSPSTVVLLGPCLGYLAAAVHKRLPGALVIAVQYSSFFCRDGLDAADLAWYPDSSQSLDSFLAGSIGEEAASGVGVIEWAPGSAAFPELAEASRVALRSVLDRLISSAATIKASGKSWFINSCRSFLLAESLAELPEPRDLPIVIAASGPSLEGSLDLLSAYGPSFFLLSVSSALAACLARNLVPDLVLATDGGFWSRSLLLPLASSDTPLALPLSALPSSSLWSRLALSLVDQGSFAEQELLPFLGSATPLPPHGTVAGSALSLALSIGTGPVIAAGLDLAALGEAEHARPHGFDHHGGAGLSRLRPRESAAWERRSRNEPDPIGGGWYGSRSLSVYAEALAQDAARTPGRLYRLLPSAQPLPGFAPLDGPGLGALLEAGGRAGRAAGARWAAPPRPAREAFLRERIRSWRSRVALACGELAAGGEAGDAGVADLLRALDLPYWAAARRAVSRGADPGPAARALATSADAQLAELERRLLD